MYADCAINRIEYINVWGIFVILHSYEETESELAYGKLPADRESYEKLWGQDAVFRCDFRSQ